jgi:hypothetical protein
LKVRAKCLKYSKNEFSASTKNVKSQVSRQSGSPVSVGCPGDFMMSGCTCFSAQKDKESKKGCDAAYIKDN